MAVVLVIEDELPLRNAYDLVLSKAGHQVFSAPTAAEGLKLALAKQPQVILLDMLMPGMSGIDFLQSVDIRRQLPETKVIAISNVDNPKIMAEAAGLGVVKYLVKVDLTPKQVVEQVNQTLA